MTEIYRWKKKNGTTYYKENNMVEFIAGVAVGAVFAPFWMAVWAKIKEVASAGTVNKP